MHVIPSIKRYTDLQHSGKSNFVPPSDVKCIVGVSDVKAGEFTVLIPGKTVTNFSEHGLFPNHLSNTAPKTMCLVMSLLHSFNDQFRLTIFFYKHLISLINVVVKNMIIFNLRMLTFC